MHALSDIELKAVHQLKQNGGDEWDRFRARRNKYKRELQLGDADAIRKALEPVMGDVINIDRNQKDQDDLDLDFIEEMARRPTGPTPQQWFLLGRAILYIIMIILTTSYQVYAQRTLYAPGWEGLFLAMLLDMMLVGLAATMPRGWGLRLAKYALIGFVIGHMALTLDAAAAGSAKAENPSLARAQKRYADTEQLYAAIPSSRVSDRLKTNNELLLIDAEIKRLEAEISEGNRLTGTAPADIRTRIRWINLIAQLFFAHLLGLLIVKELAPWGFRFKEC